MASLAGLALCALLLVLAAGRPRPAQAAPAADVLLGQPIQAAIDAAANGTTVLIQAGRYTESLTLNKPVSLAAFGDGPVTLVAVAAQRVLTISGVTAITNSTVISGLTFTGGNTAATGGGLLITGTANPLLHSLVITNNRSSANGGAWRSSTPLSSPWSTHRSSATLSRAPRAAAAPGPTTAPPSPAAGLSAMSPRSARAAG